MLKERAVVSPQLEAYVEPSANLRMDYTQMNALANQCASMLTSLGVGEGGWRGAIDAQLCRILLPVLWRSQDWGRGRAPPNPPCGALETGIHSVRQRQQRIGLR